MEQEKDLELQMHYVRVRNGFGLLFKLSPLSIELRVCATPCDGIIEKIYYLKKGLTIYIYRKIHPMLAIFQLPAFQELIHEDTLQLVWEALKLLSGFFPRSLSPSPEVSFHPILLQSSGKFVLLANPFKY